MPHSTRSPGPAPAEHCTRSRTFEPAQIAALAVDHEEAEALSPFASVVQLVPSCGAGSQL